MVTANNKPADRSVNSSLLAAGLIPASLSLYLVVTSGWNVLPSLDLYDAKRVLQIITVSICILFGLAYQPIRARVWSMILLIPPQIRWAVVLVFLLGLFSALTSDHAFYGLAEVSLYFSLLLLLFFTAASAQLLGERMLKLIAVFLLVLGSLVSLTELIGLVVHWQMGQQATSHTLFIRFSHPRFFNQVQSWLIPLLILPMLAFNGRRLLVSLAFFNLAFWWALLIYSGGRGSLLGLACAFGFVFLLVFKNPHFSRWRLTQLLALLTGAAIYLALLFVPTILGIDSAEAISGSVGRSISHSSGRMYFWSLVMENLAQQPVFGSGPGLSVCMEPQTFFAHPHNFYLQITGEWGLPAGLLAASVIIYVIWRVVKHLLARTSSPDSVVIIIVSTGVLAAAIHAIFSGVMVMPARQVCCVLVAGYLTALVLQPTGDAMRTGSANNQPGKSTAALVVALTGLLAVAYLGYFLMTEIPLLNARAETFVENQGVQLSPRLWQHGNICAFPADQP